MSCESDLSNISSKSNTIATNTKNVETEIKKITVSDSTGKNVLENILIELKKLNEKL